MSREEKERVDKADQKAETAELNIQGSQQSLVRNANTNLSHFASAAVIEEKNAAAASVKQAPKRNSIELIIHRSTLEQGERIKGVIIVTVVEQVAPDYINLKFKVKEETRFSLEYREGAAVRYGEFQSRVNWFNHRYPLRSYADNDVLMPNLYEFPFEFDLDRNHPISFHFKERKCEATIHSKLKAEFKIKKRRKLKHTVFVTVLSSKQAIDKALQRAKIDKERTCYLQNWFCFNRGDLKLHLRVKQNIYRPGDEIEGTVDVDNTLGVLPIKGLRVTLVQMVSVKELKGLQACFNNSKRNELQYMLPDTAVSVGGVRQGVPFKFKVPESTLCSVNFMLVQGTYEIVVEPIVDVIVPLLESPTVRGTVWVYRLEDNTTESEYFQQQQASSQVQKPSQQQRQQSAQPIPTQVVQVGGAQEDKKPEQGLNSSDVVVINASALESRPPEAASAAPQNQALGKQKSAESAYGDHIKRIDTDVSADATVSGNPNAAIADQDAEGGETTKNKRAIQIMWQRAMHYHPHEDKLLYTKPVWMPSHKAYTQEAMQVRFRHKMQQMEGL